MTGNKAVGNVSLNKIEQRPRILVHREAMHWASHRFLNQDCGVVVKHLSTVPLVSGSISDNQK